MADFQLGAAVMNRTVHTGARPGRLIQRAGPIDPDFTYPLHAVTDDGTVLCGYPGGVTVWEPETWTTTEHLRCQQCLRASVDLDLPRGM